MSAEDWGEHTELLGRTLYDITQLLESADGDNERVRRVLVLLRTLVPYEQCAVLEARLGYEPHVLVVPPALPQEWVILTRTLLDIFGRLVDTDARGGGLPPLPPGFHLAVPLVGLDEVIGVLLVRSSKNEYTELHLRLLSLVAANVAAYFTMLRARDEVAQLQRQRDDTERAAAAATDARDQLLALVSRQLEEPLTAIRASVRILRSATDDAEVRTCALDRLEAKVREVGAIDDVLRLACVPPPPMGRRQVPALQAAAPAADLLPAGGDRDGRLLSGVRVLLIDADLGLRQSFESVLDEFGAQVTTVASTPEAVALGRGRPDVMLFGDLAIRGDDAYDALRELTAHACPIPIASISAWREEDAQRALAAGFRLHLSKPVETGALVHAIAELAGRGDRPV